VSKGDSGADLHITPHEVISAEAPTARRLDYDVSSLRQVKATSFTTSSAWHLSRSVTTLAGARTTRRDGGIRRYPGLAESGTQPSAPGGDTPRHDTRASESRRGVAPILLGVAPPRGPHAHRNNTGQGVGHRSRFVLEVLTE
jgi:hypothetical protein